MPGKGGGGLAALIPILASERLAAVLGLGQVSVSDPSLLSSPPLVPRLHHGLLTLCPAL